MRFRSLGSGSSGNATLVEATSGGSTTRLLIDCGFGIRQLDRRLALAGITAGDIDAVFITHEHADHTGCVRQLALREKLPVWMSSGTQQAAGFDDLGGWLRLARDEEAITVGALQVRPFTVPHDAREPLQLRCTDGKASLGVLTDLGHITSHVLQHLQACTALLLECNHDAEMMAQSAYPEFLKQRIAGRHGHLANLQAAELLAAVQHAALRTVVAAHLSAQNNRPDLARQALAAAAGANQEDILVADAERGTDWLDA
ncbi:MAG: MBL fold metallo-hydrolase [Pseudomonadota bacterium]